MQCRYDRKHRCNRDGFCQQSKPLLPGLPHFPRIGTVSGALHPIDKRQAAGIGAASRVQPGDFQLSRLNRRLIAGNEREEEHHHAKTHRSLNDCKQLAGCAVRSEEPECTERRATREERFEKGRLHLRRPQDQ